jgi:16S rRNA (adenine1518-N6/adenine1519-N6)-dimethyltransferase
LSDNPGSKPAGNARALLGARFLRPKKHLGQHFLMDGGAAARIARLCEGLPRIIEIGAGTGALTAQLATCDARVSAIEIDPDLVAILRERDELRSVEIIEADALAVDYAALAGDAAWCAAGNLPYNVATPLILLWLGLTNPPERIVAMVQKDVADRFMAKLATPAYGSLTLAVQYWMEVERAFVLGPGVFYPRPRVDSAVVVMRRRAMPAVPARDREFLLQVVRAAFAYRRKTLANSLALALGIPRERTQAALATLGHDTEIRGEHFDLGAFAKLADILIEP